ncbi:hypothetical protein JG688_00017415 [Phytophthora aleatoria]|uniref:Uncharacterized protein n=1 Tax=Phytophthora aleatoria TaxID=2496075 RepID=A0A8J5IDW0_9STRA|nr:hypothetical protein JG688_00017415 [Phytophthora aleatoria]
MNGKLVPVDTGNSIRVRRAADMTAGTPSTPRTPLKPLAPASKNKNRKPNNYLTVGFCASVQDSMLLAHLAMYPLIPALLPHDFFSFGLIIGDDLPEASVDCASCWW